MINWRIVLPSFLVVVFLLRYYDFFYLYLPVRSFNIGGKYEPSIASFALFNYTLKLLYYLIKFIVIALALYAGIFLEGNKNKDRMASFADLFILVIASEFVFLSADVIKIFDFTFFNLDYDDQTYLNYYPLSLFSLLDIDADSFQANLFQTISIFEVIYIIVLGIGLKRLQYHDNLKGFTVAAYSYGSILAIWLIITTYIKVL